MPLKKGSKKLGRRRRRAVKKRSPRGSSGGLVKGEVAQVTTTLAAYNVLPNTPYCMRAFSLTNSNRAIQVAQAYQYYRIRRVTAKFKPVFDTFGATSATSGAAVPHLYFMLDKEATFPLTSTIQTFKSAGAKPVRLDDKTITRSFAPYVMTDTITGGASGTSTPLQTGAGSARRSPWLTTNANAYNQLNTILWNASSVDHLGFVFGVDQPSLPSGANPTVAQMEITIEYEFKKPLWTTAAGDTEMIHIDADTLNPQ